MYTVLRIVFCILASMCAAVTIFVFAYKNLWGLIPLAGVVIFGALMFICKRAQEKEDAKANPPETKGDFITGKVKNNDKE